MISGGTLQGTEKKSLILITAFYLRFFVVKQMIMGSADIIPIQIFFENILKESPIKI